MSSDPSNDNKNLPPWLRDVPLPPEPRGTDMAAKLRAPQPDNLGAPAAEAGLPEWLRELGDDTPSAPAPAATPSAPPASSLPEWLRELGDDTPSAPASAPAPLPEWLRDTAPGMPPANAAPLPDWLSNIADSDATALPPSTEPADTTLPGWLQAAQSEAPPSLDSLNQPAPIEPGEPADADMPNWLRNLSETDAAAPEPLQAEAPPTTPEPPADDSLPSWLREPPADSDSPDTLAPFSFDEPTDSQQPAPASPPSWLARDLDTADEDTPSWLGAASAAPDDQAPASDIPLWLQDRAEDVTSTPPPEPAAETAAQLPELTPSDTPLPSWLQSSTAAPAADELPEWLRNTDAPTMPVAPPPPPQPAPLPAQPAPAADELPEWLRDTSSAAIPSDQPGAEIPAWLHDAPTQAPAGLSLPADDPTQPAANAEDAEIPAWLRDVPAGAAEPPPPAPSGAPTAAGELPAWLQPAKLPTNVADDLPPWLRDEAGAPLPNAGGSGEGNLPSWLRGASATPPVSPLDSPPTPVDANTGNGRDAEATPAAELVGGVELPAWLRPAETEPSKDEITPTDARSLDWLTRLGAQEDEETEAASAAPAIRLTPPALPTRSPAQIEAIALLEQLAAEPFPTPAPAPELAQPSIWRRIGVERLLYLALLLAVVVALLLPPPDILGIGGPPVAPGADALFKQIGGLSANDIVLVGYEWDARRSGELRPLEQAVVDHLIQQRVKLVLISTDSQGSLLLYDLRDRLEAAGYQPRGEDYILLGYKPGAELALRSLAQDFPSALRSDFQGNDASGSLLATTPDRQLRLKTLSDFSLVLVLGDDAADVQGWMEQARTSARRADGSYVPFGFVLPAETEPIVQPYLNQPNVLHLAGKQGALAYQQLRGATGMPAAQIAAEVGQQRFSQLLYLALLLIGAIVVAIHSAVRRGRNQP